ncbi:MAG: AAA family ATPase [Verrucomicrobiota bacterium]
MPEPQNAALIEWAKKNEVIPFPPVVAKQVRPLPPIESLCESIQEDIQEPEVLVDGLIHRGTKVSLAGGSKSYKTWTLLDLALSVAAGVSWWDRPVHQGKVLYINFEIHRGFMLKRIQTLLTAKGIDTPAGFSLWNLRGHCCSAAQIVPQIIAEMRDKEYVMVVIDPTYKLMGGRDENSAGDVANILNQFEKIAVETDAAVVFGSHFSKGNQAAKEVLDRVSGSGVFARDPDTIITLTKHAEEDAFTVEPILRNFPSMKPFAVRWEHPVMHRATDLDPGDLKQPRRSRAKTKVIPTIDGFLEIFPETYSGNPHSAVMTTEKIAEEFSQRGWDPSATTTLREEAVATKRLVVRRGPHNRLSIARPNIFEGIDAGLDQIMQ